jgi:outer membrane protein
MWRQIVPKCCIDVKKNLTGGRVYRFSIGLFLTLIIAFAAGAAEDPALREAKSLLDAGQAQRAYDLLKPMEENEAGDPAFDYLLGLAALDSGRNTEAIFALQRVVDQDPNHGPARAELGRALMQANETDAARRELETLQQQNPPDEVKRVLEGYLGAIDRYHGAYRTTFARYVKTGLGFDTNVNSATDEGQVAAPGLGGLVFALAADSRELDSSIWDIGAGFGFSSPLQNDLRLVGGIDFDYRIAFKDSDFTTSYAKGHTGLQLTRERNQYSLIVQGEKYFVDGTSNANSDRELGGAILQWRHVYNDNTQVSVFGQAALIRYPEQDVRNVNRYSGGVGFAHALSGIAGSPVIFGSGFGGTENSQNDRSGIGGGKHFDREFYGVRLGGQMQMLARGTLYGSVTYQASDYTGLDPIFGDRRDDDFFDAAVGYRYRLDGNWSVNPHVSYSNNDSNIIVNDYERVEFMVTVRNDF